MADPINARPDSGALPSERASRSSTQAPTGLGHSATIPSAKRTRQELSALPKPRNTAELEILTQWYFSKALHIGKLWVHETGGSYEIAEAYNDYRGKGWLHTENCIRGYDYSRDFWRHVFGALNCGGIARNSYGQFNIIGGHREYLRLKSLQDSWRGKDAGRVRKSLARLVPDFGGEENTAILGSGRVLREGREDGASTASLAQGMSAGTAETAQQAQGVSPQARPEGGAQ